MSRRAEILCYGPIGGWFGIEPEDVHRQLKEHIDASEIVMRIHSGGGDALDGIAIGNLLRAHPGNVVVMIDGLAGSAASIIAMAGDEIVMAEGSMMMLHNCWGVGVGDADAMREQADVLDSVNRSIIAVYQRKTGKSEEDVRALMQKNNWDNGNWLSAQDCVAAGLATRVGPPVTLQASAQLRPGTPAAVARLAVPQASAAAAPPPPTNGDTMNELERLVQEWTGKIGPEALAALKVLKDSTAAQAPLLAQVKALTGKDSIQEQQVELALLAAQAKTAGELKAQLEGTEREQLLAKARDKKIPPVAMAGWEHLSLASLREVVEKTAGVKAQKSGKAPEGAGDGAGEKDPAEPKDGAPAITDKVRAEYRILGITNDAEIARREKSRLAGTGFASAEKDD